MPNFDPLFSATKTRPVKYKNKEVFRAHYIPFADGDKFLVTVEKTSSHLIQGIAIYGFATFDVIGQRSDNGIVLWENSAPKNVLVNVFSNSSGKKPSKWLPEIGLIGVKNVWQSKPFSIDSWYNGAAMTVEEIKDGWRCHCNDVEPDEDFDDLVFMIRRFPLS